MAWMWKLLISAIVLRIAVHSRPASAANVNSDSMTDPYLPVTDGVTTEVGMYLITADGTTDLVVADQLNGIVHTIGRKIGLLFHICYLPFLCTFGFIGNILSLLVLRRSKNKDNPVCIYGIALATCDCLILLTAFYHWIRGIIHWVYSSARVDVQPHAWECKIAVMVINVCSLIGILYIIAMTIDRFISVRFPLQAVYYCTSSKAKKTVKVIPVLVFIYGIPHFLHAKSVGPSCIGMNENTVFTSVYSWLTLSVNSFVPFIVLITLNIGIIYSMIKFRQSVNLDLNLGHIPNAPKVQDTQMTVTLLLISFGFLILTMPLHARYLYYQYTDYLTDMKSLSDFYLAYHFTNKLSYTNSAVNFIFYNVGGTKFRKDLRKLLSQVCHPKRFKLEKENTISLSSLSKST